MKIARNSWHARIYAWWYSEKHHGKKPGSAVNLCPYVRVVLFHAHMRFLFLTKLGYVTWSLLGLALEYALFRGVGWKGLEVEAEVLGMLAVIAAAVAAIFGICWLCSKLKGKATNSSFAQVLGARIEAGHSKICPLMEFED